MDAITAFIDFLNSDIWGASLLHWLMPVVMVVGIGILLKLFAKRNLVKKTTICPVLKKMETLELDVNVFRDPSKHTGLDVATCTEFLGGKGEVTCGKKCLHNTDVQDVHAKEKREHQEDISKGNTIIP